MSDDERREVAWRLRAMEVPSRVERMEHPEKTAAWYELICGAAGGKKDPWYGIKALASRLADLIDLGESGQNRDIVPKESPTVQKAPECDREALLALADGLEADADRIIKAAKNAQFGVGPRMSEAKLDAAEWRSIARRIREACGEADA